MTQGAAKVRTGNVESERMETTPLKYFSKYHQQKVHSLLSIFTKYDLALELVR